MNADKSIDVGSRIKEFRKLKGFSQTFMAENILGINRSTYSNYENNFRTPDLETLVKIAEALEIDISELLGVGEVERYKFESGFNIKDFDPYILKVFNEFRDLIMKIFSDKATSAIPSSLIMQNMIIDYLARYKAEKKVYGFRTSNDFLIDGDGNLYTGKKLYDYLYNKYYEKLKTELGNDSIDVIWHAFKVEDLDNPSSGFIKLIRAHLSEFGEDGISPQMLKISKKFEENQVKDSNIDSEEGE